MEHDDLQLAAVGGVDDVAKRRRGRALSFDGQEQPGESLRRVRVGSTTGLAVRVMTSSAVAPAGRGPADAPRDPRTRAATSASLAAFTIPSSGVPRVVSRPCTGPVETEDVGVVVVVVLVVAVRVFVVGVFDLPPHAVTPSTSTMKLTAMASCRARIGVAAV